MGRIVATLTVLATMTCAGLGAQTEKLSANIPFDFEMGKTLMPAGKYDFYQSRGVLTIRSVAGGHTAMILTQPAWRRAATTEGKVQFQRYGETYFLSGLWTPYSQDGITVPKSGKEKELARRLLAPQDTAVALTKH
jgi:hypothetical protein